jgi:hypothetical protein
MKTQRKYSKFVIYGDFLDSFCYSGYLYLTDFQSNLYKLDWSKVVLDRIAKENESERIKFAAHHIFCNGNQLYNDAVQYLVAHPDILAIVKDELNKVSDMDFFVDIKEISTSGSIICEFDFFPTAIDIYNNRIYVGSRNGLYLINNKKPEILDKRPALDISHSTYKTLAVAASEDGGYEVDARNASNPGDFIKKYKPNESITNGIAIACGWSSQDTVFSTRTGNTTIANYELKSTRGEKEKERLFKSVHSINEDFSANSYVWGNADRAFSVSEAGVDYYKYNEKNKLKVDFGMSTPINNKDIVMAKTASFGIVIETRKSLVIIPSDNGESILINEQPVSWRVFGESNNYTNQIHIIFDDRIEIFAFAHDYFVNQADKIFGFMVH